MNIQNERKLRVMLISPFTNSEVRSHLHLREYNPFLNVLLKVLGLSYKTDSMIDTAPWVGRLIKEFEKRNDVELYSVGPHIKLTKRIEHFKMRGINYYYYKADYSSALRLLKNYKVWRYLEKCSGYAVEIADKIKPDIVVLSGAENPVTSVPILMLEKYPRLCICQTIYNNPDRAKYSTIESIRSKLEIDIFQSLNYFCVGGLAHYKMFREYNKEAIVFPAKWPKEQYPKVDVEKKEYDFINWAFAMGARKGDEDAIRALAIVRESYPTVTLNLTGGIAPDRMDYLRALVKELKLEENVSFTPFFEKREDLFVHINKAKFALLPIKLDIVSGTIREAMYYKLPVVTYKTSGTPKLNEDVERVLIAEMNDVEGLAECMIELLRNKNKSMALAENSYQSRKKAFENDTAADDLMRILWSIVDEVRKGIGVDEKIKFDINQYSK